MSTSARPTFNPFVVLPVEETRATLAAVRAESPVSPVGPGAVLVSRWADVRDVLRDPETYTSTANMVLDPSLPRFVTQLDPPEHTELRKLLRAAFDRPAMQKAESWVGAEVAALVDRVAERGSAEIVEEIAKPLTGSIIARLVGIPPEDGPMLAEWSLAITAMMPTPRFDGPEWARIEAYVGERVRARRTDPTPPDDMLTHLVAGRLGGAPLTDREITFHVWLLFVGGLETTAYTLGMTVYHLLVEPTRWQRIVADRSLVGKAIEEGLRWNSSLRFVQRKATADTAVAGCPVHAGDTVFVGLESANHDETRFTAPGEFDLDRENTRRHMAFGQGVHTCLGAALARTELAAAINGLADRFPQLRLADGFSLATVASPVFCGPTRVDVTW
jgi:cytochrome P450 family 142 subfamily A polypeptide 1